MAPPTCWGMLLCVMLAIWPRFSAAAEPPRPVRVLFVGNSYLYVNDLPGTVRTLSAARGAVLETAMRAEPDYSLSDHLRSRRFASLLDEPWDWVVLQQGPSALPESKKDLVDSVRRIAARLQGKPTRIALMSAWPAQRNAAMSSQAEASYHEAASFIGACVLPVAGAWRIASAEADPPPLYQKDGLHPTPAGTLLAAMTATRGLLDIPSTNPLDAPAGADDAALTAFRRLDRSALAAQSQEALNCLRGGMAPGA